MGEDGIFSPDWELCIHHYVAAAGAAQAMAERQDKARSVWPAIAGRKRFICRLAQSCEDDLPFGSVAGRDDAFIELTKIYYDPILRTKHTDVGGVTHLGLVTEGAPCHWYLIIIRRTMRSHYFGLKPKAETEKGRRRLRCGRYSVAVSVTRRERHDEPLREARH